MTLRSAADPPAVPTDRSVARTQLDALAGVVEDLAGQFELRPLLQRILRHAVGLLGCHSGSICTVDEHAGTGGPRASRDLHDVAVRRGERVEEVTGVPQLRVGEDFLDRPHGRHGDGELLSQVEQIVHYRGN